MSVHEEMKGTLGTDPEIATKIRMEMEMEMKVAMESCKRISFLVINAISPKPLLGVTRKFKWLVDCTGHLTAFSNKGNALFMHMITKNSLQARIYLISMH